MKFRALLPVALLLGGFFAQSAKADDLPTIYDVTDSITTSSSTQLGRTSRLPGVAQSWTGQETFAGTVNTSTTYYYNTYAIANSLFNPNDYLLITFNDLTENGLLFISAYANSYDPTHPSQNWLGDLGTSSIAYGPDSLFFETLIQDGSDLVLVVNTTGGGTSGTNNPFEIIVDAYSDTEYDNVALSPYVAPTPEPSTFVELGTGLLALAGVARRRFLNA